MIAAFILLLAATPCGTKLAEVEPRAKISATDDKKNCEKLANSAASAIGSALAPLEEPDGEDLGPAHRETRGPSDAPGQIDAAPSLKTTGVAGGALALAGEPDGPGGTATITVNPLTLFYLGDDDGLAKASRTMDFSLVVPAAVTTGGDLSFVGLRTRIDALGMLRGKQLVEKIKTAVSDMSKVEGELAADIEALFVAAGDGAGACYEAVVARENVEKACGDGGKKLEGKITSLITARRTFVQNVEDWRNEADSAWGGLELALDVPLRASRVGEPPDALRPFELHSWLSGGIQESERNGWNLGISGRAGIDYTKPEDEDAIYAAAAAVSLIAQANVDESAIHLSVGAEGRFGGTERDDDVGLIPGVEGDFVDLTVGASVPMSNAAGLALAVRWPLWSEDRSRTPRVTVSVDWAYLLSRLKRDE